MKSMRRAIAAVLVFVCAALAIPQSAFAYDGTLSPSAFQSVNTVKGLSLKTEQKSYSPYALKLALRFQNKTSRDYDYGAKDYLEKYTNGQWYTLNRYAEVDGRLGAVEYPAVGLVLAAKKSLKESLAITDDAGIYPYFGPLEPGKYRVVRPVWDAQTSEPSYLAAEFLVEEVFLYAKEPVNLRTGPGTQHAVLRELALGERVSHIRKSGKWTLVRAGEQTGYVYGAYLAKSEADCYYNHFAVQLLGRKNVRALRAHDGALQHAGKGNILFDDSQRLIDVTLIKPYSSLGMTIAVYPSEEAAYRKFRQIDEETIYIPDSFFLYFYEGRYVIRWSLGSLGADLSARAERFSGNVQAKLKETCFAFGD